MSELILYKFPNQFYHPRKRDNDQQSAFSKTSFFSCPQTNLKLTPISNQHWSSFFFVEMPLYPLYEDWLYCEIQMWPKLLQLALKMNLYVSYRSFQTMATYAISSKATSLIILAITLIQMISIRLWVQDPLEHHLDSSKYFITTSVANFGYIKGILGY